MGNIILEDYSNGKIIYKPNNIYFIDDIKYIIGMDCSSDGSKAYLIQNSGVNGESCYFYRSFDYGITWNKVDNTLYDASSICSSDDGSRLAMGGWAYPTDYIYLSNNSGNTWTQATGMTLSYYSNISCSSTGQYLLIGKRPGSLYKSSDYGSNWATVGPTGKTWTNCCCSSTGQYQYATAGTVYKSTDYGATWVDTGKVGSFIRCSGDGKYLFDANYAGGATDTYISNDYGNSWTTKTQFPGYSISNIEMSISGDTVLLSLNDAIKGPIYLSKDYGSTFSLIEGTGLFYGMAMNSGGTYCIYADFAYTPSTSTKPWYIYTKNI